MKNIYKSFAALMMGCAIFASSCQKPEEQKEVVTPVFPEVVEDFGVVPGSTLSLTFDVNMDWSLSISDSNLRWFWIDDNSIKVDKVSGKVSEEGRSEKITVKIGVSETEEFDQNRTCDVTLTMGGESKVIARYMRPAKNRTLEVFAAKVEDGVFVLNEEGGYVYEEASEVALMWSDADADFRMPVKVNANCDWTIAAPEWLEFQEPDKTEGVVELVFTAASFDDVTGKVEFKVKEGDAVLKEVPVSAPSCAKVDVYAVVLNETGDFSYGDGGEYIYTEEPVDAFTLVWPGQDYRMPVKVDARCNWTLEMPQWLTAKYEDEEIVDRTGVLEFTFMGDPRYYPAEDATGDVVFKFGDKTVKTVSVTIPGIKDKFSFGIEMNMTSWEFNAAAEILTAVGYQALPASAYITGTKDACVVAVEMKDGKRVSDNPEWLAVSVSPFVAGEDVLQTRTVTIEPDVNDGENREAVVLFCDNTYNADNWFESDGTLKESAQPYAVPLLQHGSDMDYVTILFTEEEMASAGVTFAPNTNPRLDTYFGSTKYKYDLTYSNPYARDNAYMSLAKPYASYKIFDAARKDKTSQEGFWLSFTSEDRKVGVIDMYMGDGQTPPTSGTTEGYVVFYAEDDTVLAIIHCVYNPEVVVEELLIEFTDQSAQDAVEAGATLVKLTEGTLYEQYSYSERPVIYHLTYKTTDKPLKIKIPEKVKMHNVNPYDYKTFFQVNGVIYDEYIGPNDIVGEVVGDADGAVEVSMEKPDNYVQIGSIDLPENTYMGSINFIDKASEMVFVLICTLDLSE